MSEIEYFVLKRDTKTAEKYLVAENEDFYHWGLKEDALLFSKTEAQNKAEEFDSYVGVELEFFGKSSNKYNSINAGESK